MFKNNKNNGIISLLFLITFGLFVFGLTLSATTRTILEFKKNHNVISGDQSFYTAEAAAREGVYQYLINSSYVGGDGQIINNAFASSINIIKNPANWPYVEVNSLAISESNLTRREIIYTLTEFPEGLAFNNAIYSEGDISAGGHVAVIGDVFSGNNIDLAGNSYIEGNTFSPTNLDEGSVSRVSGEIILVNYIPPPPDINLDPYYNIAVGTNTRFIDGNNASTYLKNKEIGSISQGAVIFIDNNSGETRIENTTLYGSLITRGDLQLSGGTYTATNNYLSLIVEGNLRISGNVIINGIVYVKGTTSFGSGNPIIKGSIISAGGTAFVDLSGNPRIEFDPNINLTWKNIAGLKKESSSSPKIIKWEEK